MNLRVPSKIRKVAIDILGSMNFLDYKKFFDEYIGVKLEPNEHEKILMARAEKYIKKISWIPGLRMVAIVNSLSMYATDRDSDIDLFIVTAHGRMWFVRVMMTFVFFIHGVWRHDEDIAGNFCLSFFIEESTMDLERIAIRDDIYLYYWIYYMRPMVVVGDTYHRFLEANAWVQGEKKEISITLPLSETLGERVAHLLDGFVRPIGEWWSRRSYKKKGKPEGVIISENMLKFHDNDRRKVIRDALLGIKEIPTKHSI